MVARKVALGMFHMFNPERLVTSNKSKVIDGPPLRVSTKQLDLISVKSPKPTGVQYYCTTMCVVTFPVIQHHPLPMMYMVGWI